MPRGGCHQSSEFFPSGIRLEALVTRWGSGNLPRLPLQKICVQHLDCKECPQNSHLCPHRSTTLRDGVTRSQRYRRLEGCCHGGLWLGPGRTFTAIPEAPHCRGTGWGMGQYWLYLEACWSNPRETASSLWPYLYAV